MLGEAVEEEDFVFRGVSVEVVVDEDIAGAGKRESYWTVKHSVVFGVWTKSSQ